MVAALQAAFDEKCDYYDEINARNRGDGEAARAVFIKRYVRPSHRDAPADGCPIAALCGDIARPERKGPIRSAFAAGMNSLIERLAPLLVGKRKKVPREEVLAYSACWSVPSFCPVRRKARRSDEFLTSARKVLLER